MRRGLTGGLGTRAVLRNIEPGQRDRCPHCREPVMYQAWKGTRLKKVVANVYEHGRWDRVEHWHVACYIEAGEPYGGDGSAAWAS